MRVIIRWSAPTRPLRLDRTPAWLDRLRCALIGHDDEIVLGERFIALHCRRCRWRSPGWRLERGAGNLLRSSAGSDARPHLPMVWRPRTTS